MASPDLTGCLEPLRRVGRRHSNVHHSDVGLLAFDEGEQSLHVRGLPDDGEAGRLEGRGEGLAEEHGIIGQHDAQGRRSLRHSGETAGALGSGAAAWWNRIDAMMLSAVARQASLSA